MTFDIILERTKKPIIKNNFTFTLEQITSKPNFLEYAVELSKLSVGQEYKDMRSNGYILFKRTK
ncbi:MAG: hypothetical protein AB8G11_07865 [Saprospiraceae bacterium]